MGSVQVIPHETTIPTLPEAQWYAVQTRPRHEKKVVTELSEKHIDSYLPVLNEVHHWSDRRKVVQVPLFPGYVFVHAHLHINARLAILRTWGALGFVGPQREAIPIPESEIEDIKTLLMTKIPLSQYPFLKIGQRVRVRGGALDGLEGILITNGQKKLVISVASIQRSLSITIEGYDLEPA
ncbi:MAG: antitermination protein NusG [Acidobacteria bacterium]|nr:MAG: antitermination protein NusG [Acidobacteriota bacterium]PYY01812.1 MAG: antitermination protein NusG [Acidobacteriota bacterium]PYY23879.1 MAG: antitermination protein NusG [Acidobacteriota bacterium]